MDETERVELWSLFHELWGAAKDGAYQKDRWVRMQLAIEKMERDLDAWEKATEVLTSGRG